MGFGLSAREEEKRWYRANGGGGKGAIPPVSDPQTLPEPEQAASQTEIDWSAITRDCAA